MEKKVLIIYFDNQVKILNSNHEHDNVIASLLGKTKKDIRENHVVILYDSYDDLIDVMNSLFDLLESTINNVKTFYVLTLRKEDFGKVIYPMDSFHKFKNYDEFIEQNFGDVLHYAKTIPKPTPILSYN